MKIGIDGYFMADKMSAYGKMQRNLIAQIIQLDSKDQFYIFTDRHGSLEFPLIPPNYYVVVERKKDNFIYRTKSIRKAITKERLNLDVYIETVEISPTFGKKVKIQSLQHDFSNGTMESLVSIAHLKGLIYRFFQIHTIKLSSRVYCSSQFTKDQLLSIVNRKNGVMVTPLGYDSIFKSEPNSLRISDQFKSNLPKKFFLFVGRITVKHKNILLLLKAFLRFHRKNPEFKLLIATTENPTEEEKQLIEQLGKSVALLMNLSSTEISYLYSKAKAFIFPSYYEGFGIPIIEAQSMGCPLILNGIPVFREVSGGHAIFFNGMVDDLVRAMEEVLNVEIVRDLIKQEKENVKKYDWKNVAEIIYMEISKGDKNYS